MVLVCYCGQYILLHTCSIHVFTMSLRGFHSVPAPVLCVQSLLSPPLPFSPTRRRDLCRRRRPCCRLGDHRVRWRDVSPDGRLSAVGNGRFWLFFSALIHSRHLRTSQLLPSSLRRVTLRLGEVGREFVDVAGRAVSQVRGIFLLACLCAGVAQAGLLFGASHCVPRVFPV